MVATRSAEFISLAPRAASSFQAELDDAIRTLRRRAGAQPVVSVRLFTSRASDAATAAALAARSFRQAGMPVPAVSVIPGIGMPDVAQHLAIEAVISGASAASPAGLLFLAGAASAQPASVVNVLARVASTGGAERIGVLRVTCFYESPAHVPVIRDTLARAFPNASQTFVQIRAPGLAPTIECEAIGRLITEEADGLRTLNLPGAAASPYFSRATRVSTPRIAFVPMAHESNEAGLRRHFERWRTATASAGIRLDDVAMATNFWADTVGQSFVRRVRMEYFGKTIPAATGVVSEAIQHASGRGSIELVLGVR